MAATARKAFAGAVGLGAAFGLVGVAAVRSEAKAPDADIISNAAPVSSSSGKGDELRLVQVVFRHGARTPLGKGYWPALGPVWDVCGKAYDGVPLNVLSESDGPRPENKDDATQVDDRYNGGCSKGELTLIGQQQALDFGRWLRWRYSMVHGVLPDQLQEGVLNARSTNWSRTVATLQGVLTGLYPGTKAPIPVHTTEEIDEILYTNVKSCKRLHNLMLNLHKQAKDVARQGTDPHVEQLQAQVRAALGLPADHKVNFVELHDAMTTMLTHGKEVPEGMRDEHLLRQVELQATTFFMHLIAPHGDTGKQEEVLRLGMGVLMEMLVRRMEAAAAGMNGNTKMYLYSGHDSSLMPLLAALGQPADHWPPYMSSAVLELWRRPGGDHYIKVLYNQKELPLTKLCGSAACDLKQFKQEVLGPYLLTRDQHQAECLMHVVHDMPAGEHVETEQVSIGSFLEDEEE